MWNMDNKCRYFINGKQYNVTFLRDKICVTEYSQMFGGLFDSETDRIFLDNFAEVREYLTEKNGGEEVW